MQMLRASGTPWRRRAAIGLLIGGLGIVGPEALAGPIDAMPLTPGPGCGTQGGAHPAAPAALRLELVRAEAVAPRRAKRATPARVRPSVPPSAVLREPPAQALHAFYACAALPLPAGPGWLAVGPLRRA